MSVVNICTVTFSPYVRSSVGLYSAFYIYRLIAVNFGIEELHLIRFKHCELHQNSMKMKPYLTSFPKICLPILSTFSVRFG
jgi:hypothetical protein